MGERRRAYVSRHSRVIGGSSVYRIRNPSAESRGEERKRQRDKCAFTTAPYSVARSLVAVTRAGPGREQRKRHGDNDRGSQIALVLQQNLASTFSSPFAKQSAAGCHVEIPSAMPTSTSKIIGPCGSCDVHAGNKQMRGSWLRS